MTLALQLVPPALLLVGWLAPAAWMRKDAAARLRGRGCPRLALAAGLLVPVAAPLAWLLLRPLETLEERTERELSIRRLRQALEPEERCLVCRTPVERRFVCCPTCATELRRRCHACSEPVEFAWNVCPHCGESESRAAPVIRLTA